ncbi:hypothetical protein M405DRAFT_925273 [Rhizopogon salebrosus TDB-379]|nr:hypothetical protein M405DRAFT_925273 [Rhizopogon salebrosus TDB-379]
MLRLRKELQAASGKKKGCHRGLIVDGVKLEGVYSGTKDRMTRWRIKFKYQDDFKMKSHRKTLLRLQSPDNIRLIQIDTALFAFEPVLTLQNTQFIPLPEELLFWIDGNIVGNALVTATQVTRPLAMNPSLDLQGFLNTPTRIVLDKPQAASLLAGLTQRVSLIQGPPGTGKSFIGALLAKAIHDHSEQEILVVCYTNHALDQFLENLLKIGIPDTSMVTHLGVGSQHIIRSKADWAIIDQLRSASAFHCDNLEKAMDRFTSSKIDFKDVLMWIEFEDPAYFDAFRVPEDDGTGMTRVGKGGKAIDSDESIFRWQRGFDVGQLKDEPNIRAAASIRSMPPDARLTVLDTWKLAICKTILEEICTLGENHNEYQDQMPRKFGKDMVATNLEKAGEILESHFLTAMGENTSQMILIGDHRQLRPKVNNYNLTVEKGDGFELNRSLFEHLVLKGFPHQTLTAQYPFIRMLTYPDLTDASKTQGRTNVRGVQNNIVFTDHRHPEDNDARISDKGDGSSSLSKQNTYEVEMIWKILRYLVQQGYKKRIRLATIDNYQGEESDIVIASLTRSNDSSDIGFMNSPERLNVLISRAQDGFILIGNSQTFMNAREGKEPRSKSPQLINQGTYIYEGFPIECERHPDRKVLIKAASEFDVVCPDGGCTELYTICEETCIY